MQWVEAVVHTTTIGSDIVSEDELSAKLKISLDMLLSKRVSTLDKKHTVTIL